MSKQIGKNVNSNTNAQNSTFSIDSTTRVNVVDALVDSDPPHINICITNKGNKTLWVGKFDASVTTDKITIPISPGEFELVVAQGDIYRGPISAIFDSGGSRDVVVEIY